MRHLRVIKRYRSYLFAVIAIMFSYSLSSLTAIADFAGDDWTLVTSNPAFPSRYSPGVAVHDGKIYVGGGWGGPYLQDLWYSEDGLNWTEAPTPPWASRQWHSMISYNGKLWLIGGHNGEYDPSYFNDVWWTVDGTSWTQATDNAAWDGRMGYETIVYDDKLWLLGGGAKNDVWYTEDGENWTMATEHAAWRPRKSPSATVKDGKMWIYGGAGTGGNTDTLNDVWYSTDGVNWTEATAEAAWPIRCDFGDASFAGKLWSIGGRSVWWSTTQHRDDVWYSDDGVDWTLGSSSIPFDGSLDETVVVFKNRIWIIGYEGQDDIYQSPEVLYIGQSMINHGDSFTSNKNVNVTLQEETGWNTVVYLSETATLDSPTTHAYTGSGPYPFAFGEGVYGKRAIYTMLVGTSDVSNITSDTIIYDPVASVTVGWSKYRQYGMFNL